MESDELVTATGDDLVEMAIEVAVHRLGYTREEAHDRLRTNSAALHLEPDQLALLVLSGQRQRSAPCKPAAAPPDAT